jgi:hypothetical protein
MLRNEGVNPLDVAYKLSSVIPNIISIPFNGSGSANAIKAALLDIVGAMQSAKVVPIAKAREQWLRERNKSHAKVAKGEPVVAATKQHGGIPDTLQRSISDIFDVRQRAEHQVSPQWRILASRATLTSM